MYFRLLVIIFFNSAVLLTSDCSSHVLKKRQVSRRGPQSEYLRKNRIPASTKEPVHYYYYYDDEYDYYDDYVDPTTTTTTTTTTTSPPPRRRFRGRFRRPGRRFRVGDGNEEGSYIRRPLGRRRNRISVLNYHEKNATTISTTTAVTTTTTSVPTTTRRYYPPRYDGRYIDYLSDPNIPRELNGVDLNGYPFYPIIPEDIIFDCDDRHDGYYASVPHRCQLFHYCFGGQRFDFLCPNYTLYDQQTFTCRFVNKVDCASSELFYNKNDALYVETTTLPDVEKEGKRRSRKHKNKEKNDKDYEYYDDE